jgi:hypothetical protein
MDSTNNIMGLIKVHYHVHKSYKYTEQEVIHK